MQVKPFFFKTCLWDTGPRFAKEEKGKHQKKDMLRPMEKYQAVGKKEVRINLKTEEEYRGGPPFSISCCPLSLRDR